MAITLTANFDIYNEETVKRLQEEDPDILPTYSIDKRKDLAYNKKQVTAAITSAVIQGKSIDKIADDLQTRMTSINRSGAIKTARTAITSAQNGGTLASMKELAAMGIEVQKEWVATLDDRTRPTHRALDGQRRDLDKAFSNGLQYPGDSRGSAGEVWYCRCTIISYIPEYDSDDEPRVTYSEWEEYKEKTGSATKKTSENLYTQIKESREQSTNSNGRIIRTLREDDKYIYDYDEESKKLYVTDKTTGKATLLDKESGTMTINGVERKLSENTYNKFYDAMGNAGSLEIDVAANSAVGGTILSNEELMAKLNELYQTGEYTEALALFGSDYGKSLRAITNKAIGYDAFPTLVSEEEFKSMTVGKTVLYRGLNNGDDVTAAYCAWQYKYSNLWTGNTGGAVYGNGTYFGGSSSIADSYGKGSTIKAALKTEANIVEYSEVSEEYNEALELLNQDISAAFSSMDEALYNSTIDRMKMIGYVNGSSDVGTYAKLKGYDVIYVKNMDYYVVLNRGALIVEE